jgi:hypothetical protein
MLSPIMTQVLMQTAVATRSPFTRFRGWRRKRRR